MPRKKKNDDQTSVAEGGAESQAQADIRLRGNPEEVRRSARRLGGSPDEDGKEARKRESEIAKALRNPNYLVMVKRTHPREVNGERTRIEVFREECPISLEDVKQEVFERCGGWKYQLRVVDPEDGTVVAAMNFENPSSQDPVIEKTEVDNSAMQFTPQEDPPDALERAQEVLNREVEMAQKRRELLAAQEALEELQFRGRKNRGDDEDPRVSALMDQISDLRRSLAQDKKDQREELLMKEIQDLKQNRGGSDSTTQLMLQFMQNSQQQFQASQESIAKQFQASQAQTAQILQMIMQSNQTLMQSMMRPQGEKENFNTIVEKMSQVKNLIEDRHPSKASMVEDLMYDLVMERVRGDRGPEEEEDVMKYAIKQLTPVLKTYAEKAINQRAVAQAGQPVSDEERKEITRQEANRVAREFVLRLQQAQQQKARGQAPALPPSPGAGNPPPSPPPAPSASPEAPPRPPIPQTAIPPIPEGVDPMTGEPIQKNAPPKPPRREEEEEEEEEGDDMDMPPGPQSPEYDRKTNINAILDNILEEIKLEIPANSPEESYIVGDCLDYLDNEILQGVLGITNGTELEDLLLTHGGDADKISKIKASGESNPVVKRWLNRIVVTIQEEYERQSSRAARN